MYVGGEAIFSADLVERMGAEAGSFGHRLQARDSAVEAAIAQYREVKVVTLMREAPAHSREPGQDQVSSSDPSSHGSSQDGTSSGSSEPSAS